ncbi:MAG: PEP-CTERM sorting domain-containing protein [Myxococcota bacterium]
MPPLPMTARPTAPPRPADAAPARTPLCPAPAEGRPARANARLRALGIAAATGPKAGPFAGSVAGALLITALLLAGVVASTPAEATILVFDQTLRGNEVVPTESGGDDPIGYGDNVTGAAMAVPGGAYSYGEAGEGFTPDVTVDITSSLASPNDPGVRLWNQGYGDLENVVFTEGPGTAGAPLLFVRLTAAPGFEVDLYDFDLAHFGALSTTIAGVSVLDGPTELFAASDVVVAGSSAAPGHTRILFGTPLSAVELLIRIDLSNLPAGAQDDVGLDNVRFGQTPPRIVPEPGTALLLFAGLAGLASRRR